MNSSGIVLCTQFEGKHLYKNTPSNNDDEYGSTGETKQRSFNKIG